MFISLVRASMEIAISHCHFIGPPLRIKPANFVLAAQILNLDLPASLYYTRFPYFSVNYTSILTTQGLCWRGVYQV